MQQLLIILIMVTLLQSMLCASEHDLDIPPRLDVIFFNSEKILKLTTSIISLRADIQKKEFDSEMTPAAKIEVAVDEKALQILELKLLKEQLNCAMNSGL